MTSAGQTVGEDAGFITFNVTLSSPSTQNVSLPITISGTATRGVDFTLPANNVNFTTGTTTASFSINVFEDTIDEPSESIILALGDVSDIQLGASTTHTVTITDNDEPAVVLPTVSIGTAGQSFAENLGTLSFELTLSSASTSPVVVPLVLSGTAFAGFDYQTPATNVTFAAGDTSATVNINVIDDTTDEVDETIIVTLDAPSNATLGTLTRHTATIIDNDDPATVLPTVSMSSSGQSFAENLGALSFELRLSSASTSPVVVPLVLSGTAVAGVDYQTPATSVTFPAGETTATVNINVIDDTNEETDETIIVTLDAPGNATLSTAIRHIATIVDNDDPMILANVATSTQSVGEDAGFVTFNVTLSSPATQNVLLPVTISGTATRGVDFTLPANNVTFAAGTIDASFSINIFEDTIAEASETIIATLGNATNIQLGTSATHTVSITDNDGSVEVRPPSFTVSNPSLITSGAGPQTQAGFATFDPGSGFDPLPTLIGYVVSDISNPALFDAVPSVDNNGTLTYSPAVGQSGTSTFTVVAQSTGIDTPLTSVPQTLSITVESEVTNPGNIVTVTSAIPAGASDAGIDGRAEPPTNWARQRSSMRVAQFDLQSSLLQSLTAADITLTNLGLGGLGDGETGDGENGGTVITLRDEQITTRDDLRSLELSFDEGQLSDGVYEMVIRGSATGGNPITITGTRENGFFVLTGDYNGSGVVDNRDFTTFAYWFLNDSPPEYVDLRTPVGINAQDFVVFLDHFGQNMFPERLVSATASLTKVVVLPDSDPIERSASATTEQSASTPIVNSSPVLPTPSAEDDHEDDINDRLFDEALADSSFIAELF